MVADNCKLFYNEVLSQTISECGDFLFVGNNFSEIFVFKYGFIFVAQFT